MISTRDQLLQAVRLAELTPQGITIGPVAFTAGGSIRFGKVVDENIRRLLLTRIKLAHKQWFASGQQWSIPCLDKTNSSPRPTVKPRVAAKKKKSARR